MNKHTLSTAQNGPREIGKTITKALQQGMILMLLAGLTANKEAWAGPVIIPGSSYTYAIFGSSTPLSVFTNTFDGVAEIFTQGSSQITINELMLPSNHGYKFLIQLRSTGDIFPVAGEKGAINIGAWSNPLDLVDNLALTSVEVTWFAGPSPSVFGSWTGSASQPSPWNGFYPASGIGVGYNDIGGSDIRGFDLVFNLIPEPTSLALLGLGLFVMAGRREKGGS
jgi:hypothetical protein